MITTVYFVRHAEPDYSVEEDSIRPLSDRGKKDALKLPELFTGMAIDKMISSPFKRAIDTIEPLSTERGLVVELVDGFRERKVSDGGWIEDFNGFAMDQWADFDYSLSGGDCLREVQERNIEALEKVLARDKGLNIIIGSHGTALSTIINYYDKSYGYDDFIKIKGIMPWIVKFTFDESKNPRIESMNS